MAKHSTQFKLKVVQDYLKSGGFWRVANLYGIDNSSVRKWVLAYRAFGLPGLQKRQYQNYTLSFKLSVLEYMNVNQASVRPAAVHFNIASHSTILVWQKLYNEGGITALQSKPRGRAPMSKPTKVKEPLTRPLTELSHEELLHRAQHLEVENAYLKKLDALVQKKRLASKSGSK